MLLLFALLLISNLLASQAQAARDRVQPSDPPGWTTADGRLDGRLDMARAMLAAGEVQRANAVLALARSEAGSSYDLDLLQAQTFYAQGLCTEALVLLEPHARRHRKDPVLQGTMGLLAFDLGQLQEAESRLVRATGLAPDAAQYRNNLGFLLLVSERPEEAAEQLRQSVRLDPTHLRYLNNLGFALAAAGRTDEALQIFRSVGPEAHAIARLGLAHERSLQPAPAEGRYRQALQLDPQNSLAREGLLRLAVTDVEETP